MKKDIINENIVTFYLQEGEAILQSDLISSCNFVICKKKIHPIVHTGMYYTFHCGISFEIPNFF